MVKNLLPIIMTFLLSSCFYYDRAERIIMMGLLDGNDEIKNNYALVYRFDGEKAEIPEDIVEDDQERELKRYSNSFCNVRVGVDALGECGNKLRGKVDVEIYLRNKDNGDRVLIAKKKIDMDAYFRSFFLTQVYFGTDKERYIERSSFNIDWNKMQPFVFKDTNDTLYHYTAWYWDKRDSYEYDFPDEKYFVEIP